MPDMTVEETDLTIGDLADRTGVNPATLRMWETRHGFPVPQRRESGHRRYTAEDVAAVKAVARLRDEGVRLDQAIARVRSDTEPAAPSVYAALRRRHPGLDVYRLRKATLLAMSWAIEDEFLAKAVRPQVWAAFQRAEFFDKAAARYAEIARSTAQTTVFAEFGASDPEASPRKVHLGLDSPMRREWAVVCDAADLPVVLTAWELPGQDAVPDRHRIFEALWTVDGTAVRDASRVCAHVAAEQGVGDGLASTHAPSAGPDTASVNALFNRMVGYVDRFIA